MRRSTKKPSHVGILCLTLINNLAVNVPFYVEFSCLKHGPLYHLHRRRNYRLKIFLYSGKKYVVNVKSFNGKVLSSFTAVQPKFGRDPCGITTQNLSIPHNFDSERRIKNTQYVTLFLELPVGEDWLPNTYRTWRILFIAFREKDNVFSRLPKDIFRYLLEKFLRE